MIWGNFLELLLKRWDATKHPRHPKGAPDSKGGEFAPLDGLRYGYAVQEQDKDLGADGKPKSRRAAARYWLKQGLTDEEVLEKMAAQFPDAPIKSLGFILNIEKGILAGKPWGNEKEKKPKEKKEQPAAPASPLTTEPTSPSGPPKGKDVTYTFEQKEKNTFVSMGIDPDGNVKNLDGPQKRQAWEAAYLKNPGDFEKLKSEYPASYAKAFLAHYGHEPFTAEQLAKWESDPFYQNTKTENPEFYANAYSHAYGKPWDGLKEQPAASTSKLGPDAEKNTFKMLGLKPDGVADMLIDDRVKAWEAAYLKNPTGFDYLKSKYPASYAKAFKAYYGHDPYDGSFANDIKTKLLTPELAKSDPQKYAEVYSNTYGKPWDGLKDALAAQSETTPSAPSETQAKEQSWAFLGLDMEGLPSKTLPQKIKAWTDAYEQNKSTFDYLSQQYPAQYGDLFQQHFGHPPTMTAAIEFSNLDVNDLAAFEKKHPHMYASTYAHIYGKAPEGYTGTFGNGEGVAPSEIPGVLKGAKPSASPFTSGAAATITEPSPPVPPAPIPAPIPEPPKAPPPPKKKKPKSGNLPKDVNEAVDWTGLDLAALDDMTLPQKVKAWTDSYKENTVAMELLEEQYPAKYNELFEKHFGHAPNADAIAAIEKLDPKVVAAYQKKHPNIWASTYAHAYGAAPVGYTGDFGQGTGIPPTQITAQAQAEGLIPKPPKPKITIEAAGPMMGALEMGAHAKDQGFLAASILNKLNDESDPAKAWQDIGNKYGEQMNQFKELYPKAFQMVEDAVKPKSSAEAVAEDVFGEEGDVLPPQPETLPENPSIATEKIWTEADWQKELNPKTGKPKSKRAAARYYLKQGFSDEETLAKMMADFPGFTAKSASFILSIEKGTLQGKEWGAKKKEINKKKAQALGLTPKQAALNEDAEVAAIMAKLDPVPDGTGHEVLHKYRNKQLSKLLDHGERSWLDSFKSDWAGSSVGSEAQLGEHVAAELWGGIVHNSSGAFDATDYDAKMSFAPDVEGNLKGEARKQAQREKLRKIMKTQYAISQAVLKKKYPNGFVLLYRGVGNASGYLKEGKNIVNTDALASWSSSKAVANNFGHGSNRKTLVYEFPITDVLMSTWDSTIYSGVTEKEFIVIGRGLNREMQAYNKAP